MYIRFFTMKVYILTTLFLLIAAMHASSASPRLRVSKDAEDLAVASDPTFSEDDDFDTYSYDSYDDFDSVQPWSSSTFATSVSTLPWHHRAMLSVASRLCFFGLPSGCMCTEDAVRSAIEDATTGKLLRPRLRICSGVYIDVTSVISITGKTFRLGCFPLPLPGICGLDGGRNNQIFVGAPDDVTVFGISFDRAQPANTTDGHGGAIKITGGKFTLKESQFFGHRADRGNGGGLYATGVGTKISISSSRFERNRAVNGGAFYITGGAELDLKRTAFLMNNATKSGGAMAFVNGKGTLMANTISENRAATGNDLFVGGNTTRGPLDFITCRKRAVNIFPNLFCNGPSGIADEGSSNTNCGADVDDSGPRCNLLKPTDR